MLTAGNVKMKVFITKLQPLTKYITEAHVTYLAQVKETKRNSAGELIKNIAKTGQGNVILIAHPVDIEFYKKRLIPCCTNEK